MRIRKRRGAYSLVECLVLITVTVVLSALCAGTIHLLLKLDRAGRAASEEAVALARLARDFRDDAHQAAPGEPPAKSDDRITLDLGGSKTVEYAVRPGDVLRTLRQGGEVRRYETYRRPARASARFEVSSEGSRPIAAIVLDRPEDDRELSALRDFRIEAELGRLARRKARPE